MDLINIAFILATQTEPDMVSVDVVVSATKNQQRLVATDLVFGWDPEVLEFVGIDNTNGLAAQMSFLPPPPQWDFYGINEQIPPADGTGLYYWLSPLNGIPVYVTTEGSTLTTLKFKVLQCSNTTVDIIPEYTVFHTASTVVYGSDTPGMNVTGTMSGLQLNQKVGDLNCDGIVGPIDMGIMLSSWGDVITDLDDNGVVNSGDMAILLNNWG